MNIRNPLSREDADANAGGDFPVLKPGEYRLVVKEAEEKTSAGGNDMIVLTMDCRDPESGDTVRIWDYLVNTDKAQWKIRHFADAAGLSDRYEAGNLNPNDCIGAIVRASVKVKAATADYPPKNTVADYMDPDPADKVMASPGNAHVVVDDGDIPF